MQRRDRQRKRLWAMVCSPSCHTTSSLFQFSVLTAPAPTTSYLLERISSVHCNTRSLTILHSLQVSVHEQGSQAHSRVPSSLRTQSSSSQNRPQELPGMRHLG